jgi:hypothetical protein
MRDRTSLGIFWRDVELHCPSELAEALDHGERLVEFCMTLVWAINRSPSRMFEVRSSPYPLWLAMPLARVCVSDARRRFDWPQTDRPAARRAQRMLDAHFARTRRVGPWDVGILHASVAWDPLCPGNLLEPMELAEGLLQRTRRIVDLVNERRWTTLPSTPRVYPLLIAYVLAMELVYRVDDRFPWESFFKPLTGCESR